MLTQIFLGYRYINFRIFTFENCKFILASIFMGLGLIVIDSDYVNNSIIYSLLLKIIIGILIYTFSLIILKEKFIMEYLKKFIIKIKGK